MTDWIGAMGAFGAIGAIWAWNSPFQKRFDTTKR
jgi:hypothetical protein